MGNDMVLLAVGVVIRESVSERASGLFVGSGKVGCCHILPPRVRGRFGVLVEQETLAVGPFGKSS